MFPDRRTAEVANESLLSISDFEVGFRVTADFSDVQSENHPECLWRNM